jgi:hypothetical protein
LAAETFPLRDRFFGGGWLCEICRKIVGRL